MNPLFAFASCLDSQHHQKGALLRPTMPRYTKPRAAARNSGVRYSFCLHKSMTALFPIACYQYKAAFGSRPSVGEIIDETVLFVHSEHSRYMEQNILLDLALLVFSHFVYVFKALLLVHAHSDEGRRHIRQCFFLRSSRAVHAAPHPE